MRLNMIVPQKEIKRKGPSIFTLIPTAVLPCTRLLVASQQIISRLLGRFYSTQLNIHANTASQLSNTPILSLLQHAQFYVERTANRQNEALIKCCSSTSTAATENYVPHILIKNKQHKPMGVPLSAIVLLNKPMFDHLDYPVIINCSFCETRRNRHVRMSHQNVTASAHFLRFVTNPIFFVMVPRLD